MSNENKGRSSILEKIVNEKKLGAADVSLPILCEGDASQMSAVSRARQKGRLNKVRRIMV